MMIEKIITILRIMMIMTVITIMMVLMMKGGWLCHTHQGIFLVLMRIFLPLLCLSALSQSTVDCVLPARSCTILGGQFVQATPAT